MPWVAPGPAVPRRSKRMSVTPQPGASSPRGQPNIQDVFLNFARREKLPVHIRLMDGSDIEGRVKNFDRFAVIYGHNKALFDYQERLLVSVDDMKLACSGREIWRSWMESEEKKIGRIENVGFDPGGNDAQITCNLFGGWPVDFESAVKKGFADGPATEDLANIGNFTP